VEAVEKHFGETFRLKKSCWSSVRQQPVSLLQLEELHSSDSFLHVYICLIIYHSLAYCPSCRCNIVRPVTTNLYFMFTVFTYRTHCICRAKPCIYAIAYVWAILAFRTGTKQGYGHCHLAPKTYRHIKCKHCTLHTP